MSFDRGWSNAAIAILEAEEKRGVDSHLLRLPMPAFGDVHLYLKDESAQPSGSLKHRLAHALILNGLCNGLIGPNTILVDASSGSTAVSEAYYARLLGLGFVAVLPRSTTQRKVDAIVQRGGRCHFVDNPADVYTAAANIAVETGGHYLDQFTFAERAIDWRGKNIAESIFGQMALEPHSVPDWVVMAAGTGGTSATLGRYIRYRRLRTRLCVPDVEHSAFYDGWINGDGGRTCERPSRIEGVGRPRVEQSFVPGVIDAMLKVPDVVSVAAAHVLSQLLGWRVGASTGTNFLGALWAMHGMADARRAGSVVTVICDGGERYAQTYFNEDWLAANDFAIGPWVAAIEAVCNGGDFGPELLLAQKEATGADTIRMAS